MHTARRSFATNMYKSGIPSITLMKITGHLTESSFLKYIKVTPAEHATKMHEMWQKDGGYLMKGLRKAIISVPAFLFVASAWHR